MMDRLPFKKQLLEWLIEELMFKTTAEENLLSFIRSTPAIMQNLKIVPLAQYAPRALVIHQEEWAQITLYIQGHSFSNSEQIYHELNINQDCLLYLSIDDSIELPKSLEYTTLELNPYITMDEMLGDDLVRKIRIEFEWQRWKLCSDLLWQGIEQTIKQEDQRDFQLLAGYDQQLNRWIDEWRKRNEISNNGRYAT